MAVNGFSKQTLGLGREEPVRVCASFRLLTVKVLTKFYSHPPHHHIYVNILRLQNTAEMITLSL
jgi:hypothetical protein